MTGKWVVNLINGHEIFMKKESRLDEYSYLKQAIQKFVLSLFDRNFG